jgi:putative ABC transport system ATP-binding protein
VLKVAGFVGLLACFAGWAPRIGHEALNDLYFECDTKAMTQSTKLLIDAQNLVLQYAVGDKPITVLQGASLRIESGTTVAITGPSGSGKTSLLLLLAGLEQADAGSIAFEGADLSALTRDARADLRRDAIGIVFQSFHLLPSLTALDNVALPLQMAGKGQARELALDMLQKVGLSARATHRPSQLSGGEQQRVAIARALVHRPSLLLADEPTGNLDDQTAESVRDLLFRLNHELNTTLVLVTHDMAFAAQCDRVLRLHNGQLLETSPAIGLEDSDAVLA